MVRFFIFWLQLAFTCLGQQATPVSSIGDSPFFSQSPYPLIVLSLSCGLVLLLGVYLWSRKRSAERLAHSLALASEALRDSEALYHSLVAHLPQNIFRKDLEGRFTFANERFCQLLRRGLDQVLGKTDFDFYTPELAQKYRDDDRKVILSRVAMETVEEHFDADGKPLWVRVVKSPLCDAAGKVSGLQGIFWDITEKRNLQVQLAQAQKLESIGRLASGIAHDFNNILTIIQAHASLAAHDPAASSNVLEAQDQILQAAERAASLTNQLLTFSRSQMIKPSHFELNAVIERSVEMLDRVLGREIAIAFRPSPEPLVISGDPSTIEQIILNLALNARDAMPDGGELTISSAKVEGAQCVGLEGLQDGAAAARIEVIDTGMGIPPEHLDRVCEPFFTTKEVGKGAGLGLATSYAIVRQHGGTLKISSDLHKGTRVQIFLPMTDSRETRELANANEKKPQPEKETILLVDDDMQMRDVAVAHLRELGYRVFGTANSLEAARVWNREKQSIEMFITTNNLSEGISGTDLAGIFTTEKPDLRVLVCADAGVEKAGKNIRFMEHIQYLKKPYSIDALVEAIER